MDPNVTLNPLLLAMLAAGLGGSLGWVGLFQQRTVSAIAHAGLAVAAATLAEELAALQSSALLRVGPDHAMTTVIVCVCLLGATITLRGRAGAGFRIAAASLLMVAGLVGLLVGSQEPALAIGATLVAIVALAAPEPTVVAIPRTRARSVRVTVAPHSSPRLPSPTSH
jgi:hypothetical protein